jgi:hypothetical protein
MIKPAQVMDLHALVSDAETISETLTWMDSKKHGSKILLPLEVLVAWGVAIDEGDYGYVESDICELLDELEVKR